MLGDIADRGAFDAGAGVVPTDIGARRVGVRVVAVARLGGQIDAADKRDAVVDHDRLS